MTTKQSLGNMLWMATFLAALTSPFWGSWHFGLGVLLMAIAAELRKEVHVAGPAKAAPRVRWKEPDEAAKD